MSEKFEAKVVTPQGSVLEKMVEEVIAPGIMGEFGVLIGHTPMLTFIKPGILSYLEDGKFIKYAVSSGFCEVLKDSVSVLVQEALPASEVNIEETRAELAQGEKDLELVDANEDPAGHQKVLDKIAFAKAKVALVEGLSAH
jgi:F-type H+-transporting ATPase subunit epsilon